MKTLVQAIHSAIVARKNCPIAGEWFVRWEERIRELEKEFPSGSGFDVRMSVDRDSFDKVKISGSFHQMDNNGFYCGWKDFVVVVKPAFNGIDMRVTGLMKASVREYIGDVMHECLTQEWDESKPFAVEASDSEEGKQ